MNSSCNASAQGFALESTKAEVPVPVFAGAEPSAIPETKAVQTGVLILWAIPVYFLWRYFKRRV